MRLIDADSLLEGAKDYTPIQGELCGYYDFAWLVNTEPTVDVVSLPCKVGDEVWCLRDTRVYSKPVKGTVTEIYFRDNMDMCIVVRRLCRGRWGEKVFATEQEAQAAIDRRLNDEKSL